MKITFLGTAAANAYPLAACRCDNCERARLLGGPSLRRRSSVLVNDDLLIDLGPDIITGSFHAGCSLANVRYCLQTHSHADHLDASHFEPRTPEWAVVDALRLRIYGSEATLRQAAACFDACHHGTGSLSDPEVQEHLNIELHPIELMRQYMVGSYRVTALPANHDSSAMPLLYALEKDGYGMLYGADTASLPEETWQGFHKFGLRFDIVVLDHTYGPGIPARDHLNADEFIEHARRMRAEDLLTAKARVFAAHISHEGNPPHPELSDFARQHGYEIAYDGLVIEL